MSSIRLLLFAAGSGSVAKWLKVYEEHGEAGLRALKIGAKYNVQLIRKSGVSIGAVERPTYRRS
jgi:transposase